MYHLRRPLLLALFAMILGCSGITVSQDYDETLDFTGLKTFNWKAATQKKTGDVRVDNPLLDSRIRTAVNRSLSEKGYQKVSQGAPQFYLVYQYSIRSKVGSDEVQTGVGIGFGGSGRRGTVGVSSGGGVSQYDEGMLVIDIIAAGSENLLWRGTGVRRLRTESGPEEITQDVNEIVEKILAQFPPQTKK